MIQEIITRLNKVTKKSGGYMACCPAHDDRNPSLSIGELRDGRILIKCFAGCGAADVMASIGMTLGDLYPQALGEFSPHWLVQKAREEREKQDAKLRHEKRILEIAKADRESGKPLSIKDKERELKAFMAARIA